MHHRPVVGWPLAGTAAASGSPRAPQHCGPSCSRRAAPASRRASIQRDNGTVRVPNGRITGVGAAEPVRASLVRSRLVRSGMTWSSGGPGGGRHRRVMVPDSARLDFDQSRGRGPDVQPNRGAGARRGRRARVCRGALGPTGSRLMNRILAQRADVADPATALADNGQRTSSALSHARTGGSATGVQAVCGSCASACPARSATRSSARPAYTSGASTAKGVGEVASRGTRPQATVRPSCSLRPTCPAGCWSRSLGRAIDS